MAYKYSKNATWLKRDEEERKKNEKKTAASSSSQSKSSTKGTANNGWSTEEQRKRLRQRDAVSINPYGDDVDVLNADLGALDAKTQAWSNYVQNQLYKRAGGANLKKSGLSDVYGYTGEQIGGMQQTIKQNPERFTEEGAAALIDYLKQNAEKLGAEGMQMRARYGDASVLTEQQTEIDKLKKAGLDNNWFRDFIGWDKYNNQGDIDAAEAAYDEYVSLLKLSGMEKLSAGKPRTGMINYTRDAFNDDLMTMVYKAQGVDVGTDEYQAAAKRVRDFTGSTHAESEAFADTSGQWVDKYLNMYDQRMNTLDKYIAKNSGAYGTEYAFNADDYIQYMRDLSAYEQKQAENDQKQAEHEQQVQDRWGTLENSTDFSVYSQHQPHEGSYYDEYDQLNWQAQVNDLVALGADPAKFEDAANILGLDPAIDADAFPYLEYGLQHMTDQDRSMFFYLYNHPEHGPDEALEFLDAISFRTMRQNTEDYQKAIAEGVDDSIVNSVAASAIAPVYGMMNSVSALNTMFGKATGGTYHAYDPTFLYGTLRDTTVGEVGSNIAEATPWAPKVFGQNIFQMGYNAVMSSAESALNMAAFGNMGSVAMGFGAFNSSYQQGLKEGKNDMDAFIDALVDGGIEVGTEAMQIDALMGDSSNPLGYFLKNILTEGGEEGLGEIGRMSYDQLKYGLESAINSRIGELTVMGYDPTAAAKMAWREWLNTLGQNVATGSFSGAFMSAPTAVQSQAENYQTGKEFQENADDASWQGLLDLAGSVDLSNAGRKIYDDLKSEIAQQELTGEKNRQAQSNAAQKKDAAIAEDLDTESIQEEQTAQKNQQAQDAAAQRKDAEIAEGLDSDSAREELAAEKNAQAQTNAAQQKDAKVASDLNTDNIRQEQTPEKRKRAVSKAKIGQLYREVSQKLDAAAQDALRSFMSFDIAKELKGLGMANSDATPLAESILRIQDGTFTEADVQAVANNTEARAVLNAWTAVVNVAEKAKGKVNQMAGLLTSKPDTKAQAADAQDEGAEEPEQTMTGDDEFDAVAAEVAAKDENTLVSEGETSTLDGEEIEILGVEAAEASQDGDTPKVRIRTADGTERTVEADSIAYGTNDASAYKLAAYSAEYGANGDQMYNNYLPSQDIDAYAKAFHKAAQYGSDGRNLDVLKNSDIANVLNEQQMTIAYEIGRGLRAARTKAQQAARSIKGANAAVGKVDTSAIRKVKLTTHQKNSIAAMGKISQALGINVRFVQSRTDAQGYYTDDNGAWNANTRTLTLSIDAGGVSRRDIRFAMMDTAGHELTHYIKQFADGQLWDEYQDFVMNHLDSKLDLDGEIRKIMAADKTLDRDAAIEEVIADASVKALSRISEQDLADLAESNPTLLGKIKKFLTKWIKSMKKAIKEAFDSTMGDTNHIAKAMEDNLDEMAAKWNMLLSIASQNANASRNAVPGVEIDSETQTAAIKNSRRSLEASDYAKNPDKMAAALAKAVNVPVSQAKRYINNMFSIAKIIAGDQTRLDYDGNPLNSVLKDNAEYRFTVDMSTLCAKRLIYTGTLDAIQKAMPNTVLSSEDLCELRKMMMDRDYEVACGICYVESRRRELGSITKGFVDAYNEALAKGEDMMLGPKNNRQAFPTEGGNMLTLADVNTTEGIENIQLYHPKIYAAYMKYMNSRGVSKPKPIETRTDYRGEILQLFNSKRAVNDRNENGGLRIQSFSDFEVVHLIDMMQVITDMAQVGLTGQAYTKVPNFAEAMGRTGLKINLSLIAKDEGVDADGNLIFDDIEGMPAADAFRLRKKYSKNVGTILVGKSDAHIRAALADPRIDFVIPFHKSGWSESLYEKLGLKNYSDYTNFQNERPVTDSSFKWDHSKSAGENYAAINKIRDKSRHIDNFLPMDYWDFSLSGEENARNYLEACYYDGRIPKFPQFVNEPGYWKLLIDFKMYDNNGEGSPQLPVKPDFNMTQARRMLKEYDGGHTKLPVAQDVVNDFVKQYKGKPDVKHSKRSIDAEYQEAYDDYDEVRARELVEQAAIAAGYNPLKLYHGTNAFGFTKVDPSKADDGISFFTSTDDLTAETYVGNDARIRRIGSTNGMTVDKLLNADGKTLLNLLHKYFDEPYELMSKNEIRELVSDEGELIRKRAIWKAEEFRKDHGHMFTDGNVVKAFDAVIDALDRLSYAKNYELLERLYLAYDDARQELRHISPEVESAFTWAAADDIYSRYYNMQMLLNGDVFKVDGEWSTEYLYRTQAIDMLYPKLFKGIYELYGRTDNLLEVNANGSSWRHLDGTIIGKDGYASTRDMAAYAKANGYDGVYFHDIVDVGGMSNYTATSDVLTFFNPSDIKSADPFTFDDDGNLIPLSERFNRADEDIRYSSRDIPAIAQYPTSALKFKAWDSYTTAQQENIISFMQGVDETILEYYQRFLGASADIEAKKKFGMVTPRMAKDVKRILGLDAAGYSIEINKNACRHITNRHGSDGKANETMSDPNDVARIKWVLENYDNAQEGTPTRAYSELKYPGSRFSRNARTVEFRKAVNGTVLVVVAVPNTNAKTAGIVTAFIEPEIEKPGGTPDTIDNNSPRVDVQDVSRQVSGDTVPQNGKNVNPDEDNRRQMRDLSNASDRELLANALESLTANADELDILRRYQKRVQNLDAKQQQLQDVEERLYELKQGDAKANRDEIIKLTNNAKTISDQISRMDKELLKLEVMAPIKKLADRERESYKQKLKAQTDERLRQYKERTKAATQEKIRDIREREAEKRRKLREQGDERLRKAVLHTREVGERRIDRMKESDMKAKYKGRIQKDISTMREWLTKPTNKGHVPQFLRAPLADFLESLDFTSVRALDGGDSTKADAKLLDKMDALRRALANTRKQQSDIENGEAAFRGYLDLPEGFADQFDEALASIKRTLAQSRDDTPINRMTGEQLKALSEMIRTINTSVRKMNSFLAGTRFQQVSDAAQNTMSTLAKLGEKISKNAAVDKVLGFLDWTNTTPYYAFKRFGEGGKAIFEGLMNGWDRLAFNSKELIDYANSAYTTKQVREWSQQLHTIELNGKKVQMTTAQIMSLYCLNKRAQARGHLLGGGIRVADIQVKGKTITQADNHILTTDDIQRITNLLTNEQIAVANKLQKFMNTRCTEWGNEVSMKRFGYEAFGDEVNYFPIETDSNNRKAIDDQAQENSLFRLLNISATKSTVKNANNALVVRDIFDVFSTHGADMAKYNALALPILDALKWYNYVDKTNYEDGSLETESIQKALEKAYGKDAQKYIKNFLRDLNGVREGGRNDGMFNKMLSNYKIAAVAANLRVGMLQITSMPRAAYAIDPKYLAIGAAKNVALRNNKPAAEMVGIGLWKSLGFYDTNISRNIRDMVKHDQTLGGKIKEKSMILAEKGDAWTMGVLYGAVQAEIADKHPGVKKGSDAYNQMVNERMREIIYQTQVVDSTMTRSDIMRDTGAKSSLATAFMSEPTLTMNMLADSIYEQRMKARETGKKMIAPSKKMVKAFAVNALVLTFSAVMEAAFTAWRDDDEYETFKEKYEETFLPTLLDNMNLLNNIPFVKDIVSAIQGNSADRMDSAWAYNLWQGVTEIHKYLTGESKNPAYNGIYKTLNGLSQMSGFAVGGLTRELVSAYNNLVATPMGYTRIQTYEDSAKDAAGAIMNAIAIGDEDLAKTYVDVAARRGIEGEKLENAVNTVTGDAYVEGTIDAKFATQMMTTYGGKKRDKADEQLEKWDYKKSTGLNYSEMKDDYIAGLVDRKTALKYHDEEKISQWDYEKKTGNGFSDMREDYLTGSVTGTQAKQYLMTYGGKTEEKAEEQIDRWDYYEATGDSDGYSKYWRMYYAFENGGDFRKYAKYWIDAGTKKSNIASAIAGRYKEEYLAIKGTPAGDRMLEQLLDLYEAIGYNRAEQRRYINKNWKLD